MGSLGAGFGQVQRGRRGWEGVCTDRDEQPEPAGSQELSLARPCVEQHSAGKCVDGKWHGVGKGYGGAQIEAPMGRVNRARGQGMRMLGAQVACPGAWGAPTSVCPPGQAQGACALRICVWGGGSGCCRLGSAPCC